jgi:hypothetical protein
VTRVEHHPDDQHLLYAGWALPGTSEAAAGWRIVKFVWSGNALDHYEWADGNTNLDNVWANRASLTYTQNDALSIEAAGIYDVTVPVAAPASQFDLGFSLAGMVEVRVSGLWLHRVASGPVGNEFATAGTEFETGVTVQPDQRVLARVWL